MSINGGSNMKPIKQYSEKQIKTLIYAKMPEIVLLALTTGQHPIETARQIFNIVFSEIPSYIIETIAQQYCYEHCKELPFNVSKPKLIETALQQ